MKKRSLRNRPAQRGSRVRVIQSLALLLAIPGAVLGDISPDSPLANFIVDATQGEYDVNQAQTFVGLLNQLQLSQYTLRFDNGSELNLGGTAAQIDSALAQNEQARLELRSISGPNGRFNFAADSESEASCANASGSSGLEGLLACLGTAYQAGAAVQAATTAVSEANTIDLLINRPTTQFMMTVRGFAAPMRSRELPERESRAAGGGSGDSGSMFFNGPWGVYFQGGGSYGNLSASPGRAGFRVNNQMATGGVDYRVSDMAVAGFLFNYSASETNFAGRSGRIGADLYRFMPFLSLVPFENAYVDIMAGYSYHRYDSAREVPGTAARAAYSADQALASINLGYTYPIGSLEVTGFAGGSYIGTEVAGYRERGEGTLLRVKDYRVTSWTSTVGLQAAYAYSASFGVLQPQLRLEWVHEFDNRPSNLSVTVASLGNLSLPVSSRSRINDWGNVTAGLNLVLPDGIAAFVDYQGQVFSGGESHLIEGGVRLEF